MSHAAEAVGYSLGENYIYTKEAVRDYLEVLGDDGRLTFVLHGQKHTTRLVLTVMETLEEIGIKKSQISDHLVIINNRDNLEGPNAINMPVVVIKKSPFTQSEMEGLFALIETSTHQPIHLTYFAGLGFMLIEIPMIQKFTLILRYPTRAFAVILVALLTSGGIGSLLGGWKRFLWKDRYLPLIFIPFITVLIFGLYNVMIDRLHVSDILIRVVVAFIIIFPLGFFMGMPFPRGIKILKQKNYENAVPLVLGLNGTMSIGGSVLAVIISMKFGISYSLTVKVEIQVIFLNPIQKSGDENLIFQIALNMHSINLASYDIAKKVVLEDSSGRTITDGFYWKPFHNIKGHLEGILVVPIQAKGQKNEFSSTSDNVEWIKLTIKGVPQIEVREFLWETELS